MQNKALEDDARYLLDQMLALGRLNSLRDPLATAVEASGFTPPQLHTISWLGVESGLTMGELAQRLGVSEKTVTGIVDRLEKGGWVQRDRGEADRRVIRVRLTETGTSTYQQIDQVVMTKTCGLLMILDPEDRQALRRLVDKIVERLSALWSAGPGKDTPCKR